MQTIEYHTKEANYPQGEWTKEYDKKQWQDEATGYPCLIVRSSLGSLCGYVGVNPSHALFERHCDDFPDFPIHVRGLNFADKCVDLNFPVEDIREDYREKVKEHGMEALFVCHKPDEGEEENVWWFGFDCGQISEDLVPKYQEPLKIFPDAVYRNVEYVEGEVTKLALLLKSVENVKLPLRTK